MAYETQCGGCIDYDFQGDNEKGYCSWYRSYYYPGDSCSHQRPREQSNSSSCYITTIICDVLDFDDNCTVLNTLRSFRNDVMQKDPKYLHTLMEYDIVGPKIADAIHENFQNNNDKELWIQFYNFYLVPTANFIKEQNHQEAVARYKEMVTSLKEYFAINEDVCCYCKKENYDMSQGGHGKLKVLPTQS